MTRLLKYPVVTFIKLPEVWAGLVFGIFLPSLVLVLLIKIAA